MKSNRILTVIMSLIVILAIAVTPLTVATAEGDPDPSGSDISGSDVSGSDVSGSDVSGSDVSGSDVSGTTTTTKKTTTTTKKNTTTTKKVTTTKTVVSTKKQVATGQSAQAKPATKSAATKPATNKSANTKPAAPAPTQISAESAGSNEIQSLSIKTSDGKELLKAFLPDVHTYTVTVPKGTNTLYVTPVYPEQSNVEIKGADDLKANNYTVTITLTNPDGTSSVYTVNVEGAVPASHVREDNEGFMKVVFGVIIVSAILLLVIIIFGIVSIIKNKKLSNTTPYTFNFGSGEASDEDFSDKKPTKSFTGLDFSSANGGLNYDFIEKMAENYEPVSTSGPITAPREETKPLVEMNPSVEKVEFVANEPDILVSEQMGILTPGTEAPEELPIEFSAPTPIINPSMDKDIENAGSAPASTVEPTLEAPAETVSTIESPTEFAQTIEENVEPVPTFEASAQPLNEIPAEEEPTFEAPLQTTLEAPFQPTVEVPAEPDSTPEAPVEFGASTPIINSSVDNDIETAGFTPIPTEMPAEFMQTVEEDVHSEPIVEAPTESEPTLEAPIQPMVEAPIQPTVEAPAESEQNPSEDQIQLNFDSSMSGFVNEPVLDLPTEPFADAYVEAIEPNPTKTSMPEQASEPETISEQDIVSEPETISEREVTPETETISGHQTASETESITGAESVSESESIPETGTEPEHDFEPETKSEPESEQEQDPEPEPEPEPEPQFQDYTFQLPYEAGKTLGRNPFEQSADD